MTVLALAVASVMRRTPSVVLAVSTVVVILNSASGLARTAETLLQRLG